MRIENDNISRLIRNIDPQFIDCDDYLDIVQWNLRWFNQNDKIRSEKINMVLSALNSDIFVFQEVEEGSLDCIAKSLSNNKRGNYKVAYGTTGGQQRIAIMWDTDWIRTKDDTKELFGKGKVTTPSGKDVFPRLPLWSYFYCKSTGDNKRGIDFQLVGLHLKSQLDITKSGDDFLQRTLSASKLADWLVKEANQFDSETILLGDWNEAPTSKAWLAFNKLENDGLVKFSQINDSTDFSHLYYKNRQNFGSLLDLRVVTSPLAVQMNKNIGTIHWITIEELLNQDSNASTINQIINDIKKEITDHMPVLTRFSLNT